MTAPHLAALFEETVDRRATNSMKWTAAARLLPPEAAAADPLPMWVADMDFKAPPAVREALAQAVEHGVFGYPAGATHDYLEAVAGWQARRFGWRVEQEWIHPVSGVITALKTVLQAFTQPGESVLIQPPVYSHFHDDVRLNGRHLAYAPLTRVQGGYRFDADVFEAAIRPDTRLFILSHPHNPTGNVWSAAELRAMGEICARRGVLVVSDEIHQDFMLDPAVRHVPFAALGEAFAANSVTCTAPSKTFNVPGLQCANVVIPDAGLRGQFARAYERNAATLVNLMGMVAAQAAYRDGEAWLEALLAHLRGNHAYWAARVRAMTDKIEVLSAPSLYLAWMDFRGLGLSAEALERFLLLRARLWFDRGPKYGAEGHGYMRVNLGCPRATVVEAADRLEQALSTL